MELPGGRRPIENGPSEDERQYGCGDSSLLLQGGPAGDWAPAAT